MRNRLLLGLVAFIGIVGCGGEKPQAVAPAPSSKHSFPEAMKMLCDVDKLANLSPDEDLLEIGRKRSEWLSDQVDNGDFSEFRTLVSVKGPEEQAVNIRTKAKEVGITACPLADSIEANPTGVIVP